MISVDSLATISNPALIAKHQMDHAVQTYFTPFGIETLLEAFLCATATRPS